MKSLEVRISSIEQHVATWGDPTDAVLRVHLARGSFESRHLDRLFERIYEPFKAAVLFLTAWGAGTTSLTGPQDVMSDLVEYLTHLKTANGPGTAGIDELERRLMMPTTVRSNAVETEEGRRQRALRGLAQRLLDHDGAHQLRDEAFPTWRNVPENLPLPVLSENERKALISLVKPLQRLSKMVVMWRDKHGCHFNVWNPE